LCLVPYVSNFIPVYLSQKFNQKPLKMRLKILNLVLTILIVHLTTTISAQSNFQKGYIVELDGDTLHGFIDNRNWHSSPKEVSFKPSMKEKDLIFKPLQIKSLGIEDRFIYMSTPVEYHQRTTKLNTANDYSVAPEKTLDTLFLNLIYRGQLNLYHLYNKYDEDVFFIQKGQDSIQELVEYRILRGESLVSVKPYIKTLATLMADCGSIFPEISNVKYQKRDLEKLLAAYDACLPSSNKKFKTRPLKPKIELGVLGGVTSSNMQFGVPFGSAYWSLVLADWTWSVKPTMGVHFNLTLPRINKHSSLVIEVSNRNLEAKYSGLTIVQDLNTYVYNHEFKYGYIKLNTAFRFTFNPFSKFQVYGTAGLLNGWLYENEAQSGKKSIIFGKEYFESYPFIPTRRYEQGILMGVGFRFKRFETEVRGELSNGISAINVLSTNVRLVNFKCAYYFWSKQFF
jgi:hypothetical protein